MNNLSIKTVILADPPSVRHGPPPSLVLSDQKLTSIYSKSIASHVSRKLLARGLSCWNAVNTRYVTNYGLLMIGQELHDIGHNIIYTNGDYYSSIDEYVAHLISLSKNVDVICFTSTTPQFDTVQTIATRIRAKNDQIIIALGGPHASFVDEKTNMFPFDIVMKGYSAKKSAKAIVQTHDYSVDFDKTRFVDVSGYDDVGKAFWLIPQEKLCDTLLYSYTSFGCPNSCEYCVEHKLCSKLKILETTKTLKEIEYIVNECDVRFVHLADSDFFIHKVASSYFLNQLKAHSINACYSVNTNPKTIIDSDIYELISRFVDLGLVELLIGVEYFSPSVLKNMNKNYCIESFFDGMIKLRKENPNLIISFYSLVGLPGETFESQKENYEWFHRFFEEGLVDFSFPKFFVPYPGTDVYEHPDRYNVEIVHQRWSEYHRWATPRPIKLHGLSDDDLLKELNDLYALSERSIFNKHNG